MRKVLGFYIVHAGLVDPGINEINARLKKLVDEGWEPSGSLSLGTDAKGAERYFTQAMIKYDKTETTAFPVERNIKV